MKNKIKNMFESKFGLLIASEYPISIQNEILHDQHDGSLAQCENLNAAE